MHGMRMQEGRLLPQDCCWSRQTGWIAERPAPLCSPHSMGGLGVLGTLGKAALMEPTEALASITRVSHSLWPLVQSSICACGGK